MMKGVTYEIIQWVDAFERRILGANLKFKTWLGNNENLNAATINCCFIGFFGSPVHFVK